MKKIVIVCMVIIILPMLATSLFAQIYKYTDKNGQKRWTDDLGQIPVEQRQSAEQVESIRDVSQEAPAKQKNHETVAIPNTDSSGDTTNLTLESLLKEKSELEKQYQLIVEERKQIEEIKAQKNDAAQRQELKKKISAYNAKTKQYEIRLEAYNAKAEAYNKKINPTNKPPTP